MPHTTPNPSHPGRHRGGPDAPPPLERRRWRGRRGLLTGLLIGALLAAFLSSEGLAAPPRPPQADAPTVGKAQP